jgi:hyperosmotically inducible protein
MSNRLVSGVLLALMSAPVMGAVPFVAGLTTPMYAAATSDHQLAAAVKDRLKGKNYKDVTVLVENGVATLSGQVDLLGYKVKAVKEARKVKGISAVRDNIAVGGPTYPDAVLEQKLLSKIQVDRVGFGQVFNAIGVSVHDGVATLEGHALGPVAYQSAIGLTEYQPGVKGLINKMRIDPVSPMDDGIRLAVYRAIYRYPPLQQYAIVPSRPIRISVQNGNVTLYGIVNNQMDKQLAYTRAMQVPNVFKVTNDLVVPNSEQKK